MAGIKTIGHHWASSVLRHWPSKCVCECVIFNVCHVIMANGLTYLLNFDANKCLFSAWFIWFENNIHQYNRNNRLLGEVICFVLTVKLQFISCTVIITILLACLSCFDLWVRLHVMLNHKNVHSKRARKMRAHVCVIIGSLKISSKKWML